ncbi:MAG TPA: hypothetical protein PKO06_00270 [Candidatus Ozemobacteraceae bacterium]|mgnify:CR=1 FL=1|nr:hypothetical protein [Candidatus Ozemobacteraceae bacterium]
MEREGPVLELLMRRLAECPPEFLGQPLDDAGKGEIDVAALVWDTVHELSGKTLSVSELAKFQLEASRPRKMLNHLRIISATVWLLADGWFRGRSGVTEKVGTLLLFKLVDFSNHVGFAELLSDSDRREELIRRVLQVFGYRPAGETIAQATERLQGLDSAERAKVLLAAKQAEDRARKIREEAARKAAEEAAASYGRE